MIDILRGYLAQASSPEFMQTIDEAHTVLDEFGIEDYADIFVQILMMDDVVDRGQTVQDVYDSTHDLQVGLLRALGVTVSGEARVDHLSVLLRGLKAIESFHDPAAILRHCELESHPEELLAEVLSITTGAPAEDLLVDLHGVDQPTIQRIVEVAIAQAEDRIPEGERLDKAPYVQAWRRFREFADGPPVLLERFFSDGLDVGYPFALYVNMIGPELETLPPAVVAANLVAMALISSDGNGNPRSVISTHIDTMLHDLDLITKVTVAANDLLLKCEIRATTAIRTETPHDGQANLLFQGDGG
ncbi:hypothetical protein HDG34_003327 [Paraburkholderia sp. HC6.4b]|uniref:hypothetical protein n=1 Tax=unclassified Paraburkholderia TaxID=2615204 RepID=UPI00160B8045|nr:MULTISPECIES: hypothetical protein [unclassified Paraburkholderia]MBB5409386.1 hypothetical protein [Paraburkholderia sp. HC6.4b]MBB5451115.1 hypothetical protein [Paraburkholderia sp. Kb1A]